MIDPARLFTFLVSLRLYKKQTFFFFFYQRREEYLLNFLVRKIKSISMKIAVLTVESCINSMVLLANIRKPVNESVWRDSIQDNYTMSGFSVKYLFELRYIIYFVGDFIF